jgi:phosphoketolase
LIAIGAPQSLSVGQIYLLDNLLLQEPLRPAHIKLRLLGHWGTTPGLNFNDTHLNRAITARDLNIIFEEDRAHVYFQFTAINKFGDSGIRRPTNDGAQRR